MAQALILGTQPLNEYDQKVLLFTPEWGRFDALARGSLKSTSRQSLHLDSFNTIDCEFIAGRSYPIITGAHSITTREEIKRSLPRLAAAGFFAQAIDVMVPEREPDEFLFNLAESIFDDISKTDDVVTTFRKSQRDLLMAMGYLSDRLSCSLCSASLTESSGAFDHRFGGLVCTDCFSSHGRGVLLSASDISSIVGKPNTKPGRTILDSLFEYNAGENLRSLDFFYRVTNGTYFAQRNMIQ